MFGSITIIMAIFVCMGLLVVAAACTERKLTQGRDLTNNGVVYALSLGIFYSAWTYYGSVGFAARSGFLFFTFYIGSTLAAMLWWIYLRKLVRIKNEFRLTSIADFIAARYGHSQLIAAIITVTIIVGIAPYIALQLKAIRTTYAIIAEPSMPDGGLDVTLLVVVFMIAFTIIFGVRHMDPTKRHAGMVMSVALESLVQLLFFLIAGCFIVFFVFDGFDDIFRQLQASSLNIQMPLNQTEAPFFTWVTFILLTMSAVLFLPRQFHIGVVELSNENNIRSAMWIFPLYTLLTTLFMFPIAMAGLLKGLSMDKADTFVLLIPAQYGNPLISLLIFIGGFSAATSMIMISSMTLSTMITNHLVLPLIGVVRALRFLQRHLFLIKRFAVAVVIILGYAADLMLGDSYALVSIGLISFAVAAQFAPAIIGGIFWRQAGKAGALMGLGSGILIWFYTLLIPAFARSGWISMSLLESGPFGIGLFRPEHLFGIAGMNPISHGVMWSLFFNTILYLLGSLYFGQSQEERRLADTFVDIMRPRPVLATSGDSIPDHIYLKYKLNLFKKRLKHFFDQEQISEILDAGLAKAGVKGKEQISVLELAEMVSEIQKRLSGAIGSAAAHHIFNDAAIYTADEFKALKNAYADILLELNVSPEELIQKIDYYQEREKLMTVHAEALLEKVVQLKLEIAERERVEIALQENEKRFQVILESNPDPVVVYDEKGFPVFINPAFTRVFGWRFEEIEGRRIPYVPETKKTEAKHRIKEALSQDLPVYFETQRITKEGQLLDVAVSIAGMPESEGRTGRFIVNLCDITETQRLKTQIQQTQKMQAIGTLAGGIAHDFNNILAAILGFTELSLESIQDDPVLKDNLEEVLISTQRARELVKQILTFSRRTNHEKNPLPITPYIKEALNMMRSTLPSSIEIRQDLQSNGVIDGDAIQIHQVIMNLCTNAAHAIGKKGGVIEIAIKDIMLDSTITTVHPDLSSGPYIRLSVKDNGCGMPIEVLNRVFEPFFTTKAEGEGTGMGLSVVHGIVKSHGGEIIAESEPGKGTTITILLPDIKLPCEMKTAPEKRAPKGNERILFVDDEATIGRWSKKLLNRLGYEATIQTSSVEALKLFKTRPDHFDLLITDMTMPMMTGDELARQVKTIRPDLPIILCTGHNATIDQRQVEDLGIHGLLLKPISKEDIACQIRLALDQEQSPGMAAD